MNIQRTVYGVYLQTCLLTNRPIVIPANSSMNQLLNINAGISLISTDRPNVAYFAIGNGGHTLAPGANGTPPSFMDLPHRSTDASLYSQLPFVLRPLTNDLTLQQMANYRLRKIVTYNGITYAAYYLKAIDYSSVVPAMEYNAVLNGVTTITHFVPTTNNLNPIPPVVNNNGLITTTGDYLTASATLPLTFQSSDITEILNACTIIYGNPNTAIISEIAMCSGVDKLVTGTIGNSQQQYTEAIGVQIISFMNSSYPMVNITNTLTISFNFGYTEPLLISQ